MRGNVDLIPVVRGVNQARVVLKRMLLALLAVGWAQIHAHMPPDVLGVQ